MYFIGYSKWLLLCSRLVAGDTHTLTHSRHEITPKACSVSACCEGVTQGCCFPLRCRCRSGLLHLRFPDSEHSARGARRHLRSHHGLSTSRPACGSVSPPSSYHRQRCHFTSLHLLLCLLRKISDTGEDVMWKGCDVFL